MQLVQVYVKQGQDEPLAKLLEFLMQSSLTYEVKEVDATFTGRDGVERPFTMPYGKHKGQTAEELPTDYLKWTLNNHADNLLKRKTDSQQFVASDNIINAITAEFKKRQGS